jgi:predicted urease superfamily metal-dependent hydrolase
MQNGDISNELPKRILVVEDVFLLTELETKKLLKLIPVSKELKKVRKDVLSYLYMYTVKQGITLELISYTMGGDTLDNFYNDLDKLGTNPFRYYSSYASPQRVVAELPYRPEVIGVIDIPTRALQYGHWGLDMNSL